MKLSWQKPAKCSPVDNGVSTRGRPVRAFDQRFQAARLLNAPPRAVASYSTNGVHQSSMSRAGSRNQSSPQLANTHHSPSALADARSVTADRQTVREASVKFCLTYKAEFGQRIRIVGAKAPLGEWDHTVSPELEWSEGHVWHATLKLPQGSVHEYKFVLCAADGVTPVKWQEGNNAVIAIMDDDSLEVYHEWADAITYVVGGDGQKYTSSERIAAWGDAVNKRLDKMRWDLQQALIGQANSEEAARVSADALKVTQSSLDQAKQLVWVLQVLQKTKTHMAKADDDSRAAAAEPPASKAYSWGSQEPSSYSSPSSSESPGFFGSVHNGAQPHEDRSSSRYDWGTSYRSDASIPPKAVEEELNEWGRPMPRKSFFDSPTPSVAPSYSAYVSDDSDNERNDEDDDDSRWGRPVKSFW